MLLKQNARRSRGALRVPVAFSLGTSEVHSHLRSPPLANMAQEPPLFAVLKGRGALRVSR